MPMVLITLAIFALCFAGLAVGVILTQDKELGGSCGGVANNPDCCQACPEKDDCDDAEQVLAAARDKEHPLLQQVPPEMGTTSSNTGSVAAS